MKLGSELKELETVQDELEKKEQELRAERNAVIGRIKRLGWRLYPTA